MRIWYEACLQNLLWEASSRAEEKTEETSWNFGKEVKTFLLSLFFMEMLYILLVGRDFEAAMR